MYILWLDRFISLHTALCSSTLDPFSPKAKSPVSWLGFNKCSLLLTSYFSKKKGERGGLEWTALYATTSVSGQFSAPAFTADQNVKLLFLQQSISRTAGAPLVISELGKGLKCRLPCSEQHASYHWFSMFVTVQVLRVYSFKDFKRSPVDFFASLSVAYEGKRCIVM